VERAPLKLAPRALVEQLARLLGDGDGAQSVLAFDGDGTLWSGDVGEDLFHGALKRRFLRPEALEALLAEARKFGLQVGPGAAEANDVACTLMESYLSGTYPERDTCGMMTWCYAGHAVAEVEALALAVLEERDLGSRLTDELGPVLEWSRRQAVRTVVVSASPRMVVEPAAAFWGFSPGNVAAATPRVVEERIAPQLLTPVPYAEVKPTAGRALFGTARWLASFGDNVFDIEMLQAAELGIAVRPKPKLEDQLKRLGFTLLGNME